MLQLRVSSEQKRSPSIGQIETTSNDKLLSELNAISELFSEYQLGVIEEERGNFQEAIHHYQNATNDGNSPDAWYALGKLHSKFGTMDSREEKITDIEHELMIDDCYKRAVAQGHREAAKEMGMRYAKRPCSWSMEPPFKTAADHARDLFFFAAGTDNGFQPSSFAAMEKEFSIIHYMGAGYSSEEVENLKAAAKAGLPDALYCLGRMQLSAADKTLHNRIEGIENLAQAAKKRHLKAAFELGNEFYSCSKNRHFWESSEKTADEEKAIEFYQIALNLERENGYCDSAYSIGVIYESRIGFFTNAEVKQEAIFYYLLAATDDFRAGRLAKEALKKLGIRPESRIRLLNEMISERLKKEITEKFALLSAGIASETSPLSVLPHDISVVIKEKLIKLRLTDTYTV